MPHDPRVRSEHLAEGLEASLLDFLRRIPQGEFLRHAHPQSMKDWQTMINNSGVQLAEALAEYLEMKEEEECQTGLDSTKPWLATSRPPRRKK